MTKQRNTGDDHPGHASEGRRKRVDETVDTDPSAATAITVVGIGASAGGIEALGSFFDAMPTNSGCAFVVVLHLDPKRESEMARILSGRTTMSVAQVEDGMALAPTMSMSSLLTRISDWWTAG
ncbi:chemotaxis protein CheB [Sinorhizobium fredii]|uniref:protein-glutamate methylesterase n=1 Tax=Rhizobium fredii TaxID=380 RepID=A0A844A6J1_RHIFR|nr:chemotaxis protein CheB [Sinorhizobium fredii]MQX08739.1 chemotaxis protein CheB [Sinorhizobium fredii]GEC35489.1 hypothetical protein EFR01_56600 [Sinorhizobium fredii]GLS09418.1 hypothetical protein GCM10007864_30480 [Sinorhizobium fredii]